MIALVLGGWLGPVVILAAVLLGGCAFRALDRAERGGNGGSCPPVRPRSLPRPDLIAQGIREGWESHGAVRKYR